MDFTATILAAAHAKPDPAFPSDGIDLLPVCTGKLKITNRTFYWRLAQEYKEKAIRDGDWKYLKTEKGEFLFNLIDDPGEHKDVKAGNPSIFAKLKAKYGKWEQEVLEPVAL